MKEILMVWRITGKKIFFMEISQEDFSGNVTL